MNSTPAMFPAKPLSRREHVRERSEGRIYITAKVEALPSGYDAWTVTADLRTGEYVKRGRIFSCPVKAAQWLRKQTVATDV